MVSSEESKCGYENKSNERHPSEESSSSSSEDNSDSENSLYIQPPQCELTSKRAKHQSVSAAKSSHRKHTHRKEKYHERRHYRKEDAESKRTKQYAAGRYNKQQRCMEDFVEHSMYMVYHKKESRQTHEERKAKDLEKLSSSKRTYDNEDDSHDDYKNSKRHKPSNCKEKINSVLQDKKIDFITEDVRKNCSDTEKDANFLEEIADRTKDKKHVNPDTEMETLKKQRQHIKNELEKEWELMQVSSVNTVLCTTENEDLSAYRNRSPPTEIQNNLSDLKEEHQIPQPSTEENRNSNLHLQNSYPESPVNNCPVEEDLPPYYPAIQGCRSVNEFQLLNHINEGTYGIVYRARDKRSKEIVAMKRLKMEKEHEGFPVTSLREINTMLKGQHLNIITVKEIVMGSNLDKIFIVMDYIEHDLKSLIELMRCKKQSFTAAEVKCLLKQLLCAIAYLHDNWILHRDLKTSNILLSHNGILKVGDFGLAREYGSPLKPYTPLVVTLWYRAPELLLGAGQYSTPIDVWSVGCIFGELVHMNPVFQGKSEIDQIFKIFRILGNPNESIWPGYNKLPVIQKIKISKYSNSSLKSRFHMLSVWGQVLLEQFLTYDPKQRITAEDALQHPYFNESPLPIDPSMLPKWPAKSELGHRQAFQIGSHKVAKQLENKANEGTEGFRINAPAMEDRRLPTGGGFSLKF